MTKTLTRIAFLVLVLGGGILIGTLTGPGEWYANLNKPVFNPPGWVFGPVWTVLYVLIAMAGWRQFERDRGSPAMRLWWAQLGLNFLWSPAFFVLHQPWLALAVILSLLVVIVLFIKHVRPVDRVSAWAFVPYLAWVAFATVLNLSTAVLN
ncbi:TspO/MBR family protein [Ruegeria arenilitoris]|uniref:TspO/MBR family protein n=1 Tax=Ruegeria arenilitoris TaxID=1173585 RepID=UPI00147AD022|nr:TspO/MBR family protein [Ruegeria arenilitoris]